MFSKGQLVKTKIDPSNGIIEAVYDSWEDLKSKNDFLTIDPHNESEQMDSIEKIIKGDPKDNWLKLQSNPYTEEQLSEKWFEVILIEGGAMWTCESRLSLNGEILN